MGDVSVLVEEQPGQGGVGAVLDFLPHRLLQIIDGKAPVGDPRLRPDGEQGRMAGVVFIRQIPHQLAHQVFDGYQAFHPAVFVQHHRHPSAAGPQVLQHPHHRGAFRRVVGFPQRFPHLGRRQVPAVLEHVFGVQNPLDGIQIPFLSDHRKSGVGGVGHRPAHLFGGDRQSQGHDVHPGGHYFPHRLVGRLEQALDDLPLPPVDVAALFAQRRQSPDVGRGDGLPASPFYAQQAQQPPPQTHEQPGQGADSHRQAPDGGGGDQAVALRAAGGQSFWGHLPEDQHQHGHRQGGQDRPPSFPHQGYGDDGGQGGGQDVDEVVGDEDGADGAFQIVDQDLQAPPPFSGGRQLVDALPGDGGQSGFAAGQKPGGQQAQPEHGQQDDAHRVGHRFPLQTAGIRPPLRPRPAPPARNAVPGR